MRLGFSPLSCYNNSAWNKAWGVTSALGKPGKKGQKFKVNLGYMFSLYNIGYMRSCSRREQKLELRGMWSGWVHLIIAPTVIAYIYIISGSKVYLPYSLNVYLLVMYFSDFLKVGQLFIWFIPILIKHKSLIMFILYKLRWLIWIIYIIPRLL